MEKVKRFFRNFNEKKSYQIVFFVVSMCVVLGSYIGLREIIATVKSHEYTIIEDRYFVKYIENVEVVEERLSILGWCFYRNVDSSKNEIQVFLRNINDEEDIVWLDTQLIERKDVDAYYGGEVDYSHTGFIAKTSLKNLNIDINDYEIFIRLTYVNLATDATRKKKKEVVHVATDTTKRYICDGKLSVFRPKEEREFIKTASEELNEVFNNGQLLMYRADYDIYVYQYGNQLYWIAGEQFIFEEDGTTYIEYQLDTTRVDKLPEYRLENEWYWDNIGFVFEHCQMEDDTYPYRVAKKEIPNSYPVTCIWTGYYVESWIWKEHFNIDIRK